MTGRVVTYAHRPKRPPRKQQAALLTGTAVVTKRARKPEAERDGQASPGCSAAPAATAPPPPANDDGKPAPKKSAIAVTGP
jgi:hypothetical protein